MSFRLFIYYCALCGAWAAFFGWFAGLFLSPSSALGKDGIKGMWLGMAVALGLGLVDSLWNLSVTRVLAIAMRVTIGLLVGCVGGLMGGVVGHVLYDVTPSLYVIGWMITGLLVGASIGVFELLASIVQQQDLTGSRKKIVNGAIGGAAGGLLGGILSLLLKFTFSTLLPDKDQNQLWSPTGWGFVALGASIGLLIGLAQVILKEAWIKVEKGRRPGREMILTRERTTIGRAESCDIGLFGDNRIEKLHASILLAGNRYYVEDQQTPTGTFVNEEPVAGRTPLKSGDRIRVGGSVLCFKERAKR